MSQSASSARLSEGPLLDERAEDVGERLVQGPGLPWYARSAEYCVTPCVSSCPMTSIGRGEADEQAAVPVAVDHLGAVQNALLNPWSKWTVETNSIP